MVFSLNSKNHLLFFSSLSFACKQKLSQEPKNHCSFPSKSYFYQAEFYPEYTLTPKQKLNSESPISPIKSIDHNSLYYQESSPENILIMNSIQLFRRILISLKISFQIYLHFR